MSQAEANAGRPSDHLASPRGDFDFAAQFQASYRVFWLIAAGIVRDPQSAEDVVQEAAVVALSKRDQFQPGTSFTAWVAQTVRFVALNYARRRHRSRAVNIESVADQIPDPTLAARPRNGGVDVHGKVPSDQQMFDDRIMNALNSVNETARACLLLRTLESMEYSEIAEVLQIPPGTAMSHVHRTRMYLRERLGGVDKEMGSRNGRHG